MKDYEQGEGSEGPRPLSIGGGGPEPGTVPGRPMDRDELRKVEAVNRVSKGIPVDGGIHINRLTLGAQATQMPLRERVYSELSRGYQNQQRFARVQRAAELIERFPEVAELVELLREF